MEEETKGVDVLGHPMGMLLVVLVPGSCLKKFLSSQFVLAALASLAS